MSYNAPSGVTTGLGVCAAVVDAILSFQTPPRNVLELSLSNTAPYFNEYQTEIDITDASGNVLADLSLVLTGATAGTGANAGTTSYAGTITGGGTNNFAGLVFQVTGDTVNPENNGYFVCISNTTIALVLANANGVTDSFSGHAKSEAYNTPVYLSRNPSVATVSSSGLITAVAVGHTVIEVSYPVFNNTLGTAPDTSYQEKCYLELNVKVVL